MGEKEYCPHCEQPIMKHKHTLNKSLINIFMKAVRRFAPGEPFHRDALEMTPNENGNFAHLRYFGLIRKHFDPSGHRVQGNWTLTESARSFVLGGEISKSVTVFNNKIIETSEEKIRINEVSGHFEPPKEWARRAESIQDLGQRRLFD